MDPDLVSVDGELSAVGALHAVEQVERAREQQRQFAEHKRVLHGWLEQAEALVRRLARAAETSAVVTPPELKVLELEVRLGARAAEPLDAGAALLQSKLEQAAQRLRKLAARIDDTASRVLVTGDLNAGKSSLCNALLRRRVLPVDQQPCTDVFCEVVDSTQNGGIEEVHAVKDTAAYSPLRRSTYTPFALAQLEQLVREPEKYTLLVVYVRDPRPPERSLLANGVVDIRLIDAPGLNVRQVTTTQLFGRQEEIDLVIFVVSAENHFTQSAQEFVRDTAQEKSLVFIAVNQFDKIADKERCQQRILGQVGALAPETRKQSADFVHFVSSNPPDAPPDDPFANKDLDKLDAKLRSFVLEKRSQTKLAPARTYLVNAMRDVARVARASGADAAKSGDVVRAKLKEVAPLVASLALELDQVAAGLDTDAERLVQRVQTDTESAIAQALAEPVALPPWRGASLLFEYAASVKTALLEHVLASVESCEEHARSAVASQVEHTRKIGVQYVGAQPAFNKQFVPSAMFSRKRDLAAHNVDVEFSVVDVLRLPRLRAFEKDAGLALIPATGLFSVYQCLSYMSYIQPLSRVVGRPSKQMVLAALAAAAAALAAYALRELPRSVPAALAAKIKQRLETEQYARANAERVARECRAVLRTPLADVRTAFNVFVNTKTRERAELETENARLAQAAKAFTEIDAGASALVRDGLALDLRN